MALAIDFLVGIVEKTVTNSRRTWDHLGKGNKNILMRHVWMGLGAKSLEKLCQTGRSQWWPGNTKENMVGP